MTLVMTLLARDEIDVVGSWLEFHLNAGVGVVTSDTSRGVSGIFGLGFKFFTGKAIAWRIDLRDNLYGQELLEARYIVNDVSLTAGMSLFLPFGF